jgi:hypothetical protein
VPLEYEPSPSDGPLRQAEVLKDVVEPRVLSSAEGSVQFVQMPHPLSVVMSQDCDLEQDYNLRFPLGETPRTPEDVDREANALQTVILCDAYETENMEEYFPAKLSKAERRLVAGNRNERYHCLGEATCPGGEVMAPVMLDLRTPYAVPAAILYEQLADTDAGATRLGVVPVIYSHDLMQRFFSYQARVALPPLPPTEPPLLAAGDPA